MWWNFLKNKKELLEYYLWTNFTKSRLKTATCLKK